MYQTSDNNSKETDDTTTQTDFFVNEFIDDVDCNSDCIYKNTDDDDTTTTTAARCNGSDVPHQNGVSNNTDVIFGNKTDLTNGKDYDCDLPLNLNAFESICLNKSDINHNGDAKYPQTEPCKSDSATCNGVLVKSEMERSVETSTETLVSENIVCGSVFTFSHEKNQ